MTKCHDGDLGGSPCDRDAVGTDIGGSPLCREHLDFSIMVQRMFNAAIVERGHPELVPDSARLDITN